MVWVGADFFRNGLANEGGKWKMPICNGEYIFNRVVLV